MRLESPLIHVERAVDLDLERIPAKLRAAIAFGDVAPGIGCGSLHAEAFLPPALRTIRSVPPAGCATEAISQHQIRHQARIARVRRHGMTIDEAGAAEGLAQAIERNMQPAVIRQIELLDPRQRLIQASLPA